MPKRPCVARVCRCLAVTMLVCMMLWMFTATAALTYLGAKAHRCIHPRNVGQHQFSWTPADVANLELGLVAGSLHVRSCPFAKNVSLTIRTYAGTETLLGTMVVEKTPIATGHRVVLHAPSFDWTHCQHASFELIVPENANVDLKVQALLGKVDFRVDHNALRHVLVHTKAAHIDVSHSTIGGTVRVESELAYVRVRNVTAAQDVIVDVRTGYLDSRYVDAKGTVHTSLRYGKASLQHLNAVSVRHESELAHVSLWNVDATANLTVRVDYGALNVAAAEDFHGRFAARSPYGFLTYRHADQVQGVKVTRETLAVIEGNVAHVGTSGVATVPRNMDLDALYGSIDLFFPNPGTKWERDHRRH